MSALHGAITSGTVEAAPRARRPEGFFELRGPCAVSISRKGSYAMTGDGGGRGGILLEVAVELSALSRETLRAMQETLAALASEAGPIEAERGVLYLETLAAACAQLGAIRTALRSHLAELVALALAPFYPAFTDAASQCQETPATRALHEFLPATPPADPATWPALAAALHYAIEGALAGNVTWTFEGDGGGR